MCPKTEAEPEGVWRDGETDQCESDQGCEPVTIEPVGVLVELETED